MKFHRELSNSKDNLQKQLYCHNEEYCNWTVLVIISTFDWYDSLLLMTESAYWYTLINLVSQLALLKKDKYSWYYNSGHNILELYSVLVQVWFPTSKMKLDI